MVSPCIPLWTFSQWVFSTTEALVLLFGYWLTHCFTILRVGLLLMGSSVVNQLAMCWDWVPSNGRP